MSDTEKEAVIILELGLSDSEEQAEGTDEVVVGKRECDEEMEMSSEVPEESLINVPESLVLAPGTESYFGVSTDSLHAHQETVAFEQQLIVEVRFMVLQSYHICTKL